MTGQAAQDAQSLRRCRSLQVSIPLSMSIFPELTKQLHRCKISLAASLPDDWVAPLISEVEADPAIRHVPVGRESEAIAICSGAFLAGQRSVAIMGTTGLLTCTGELATLNLRHQIPVFIICSQRGSYDDHRVYQEVQGRRTTDVLKAFDFPYMTIDHPDEVDRIPDAYEAGRLQKRPFVLLLTRKLLKGGYAV
jgi:sulfopyruvate decarboxylase subunit alpha